MKLNGLLLPGGDLDFQVDGKLIEYLEKHEKIIDLLLFITADCFR
jgi:hypothetical protein